MSKFFNILEFGRGTFKSYTSNFLCFRNAMVNTHEALAESHCIICNSFIEIFVCLRKLNFVCVGLLKNFFKDKYYEIINDKVRLNRCFCRVRK